MKNKYKLAFLSLISVSALSVFGASQISADDSNIYNYQDFNQTVSNTAEPTGEGTLRIGYAMDTPFEGTLNWAFYTLGTDSTILNYFDESVFTFDENRQATNDGAMEYDMDLDNNTVTFTVKEGVKWHDGEPLTIEDYVYSYEIIGHPEYMGVRGTSPGFTLIEGYNEYRAGEADEISGIEIVDDLTAVFTYTELSPSLTSGGFWFYAMPKHYYEGIDITDMASAPETRERPIGIGPYMVDSITPGEAVIMKKFEDYWRGEPQLDGIDLVVTPTSTIANELANGNFHMTTGFPTTQYPDVADMEGVEWLASIEPVYDYIGFKYGEWDDENGRVDYKPEEMKMGDKDLRLAMWHAIDNVAVGERFYNGLRLPATTLIPPSHADYHNADIETPTYDPDEANRILDEAGYVDVDGDGFRETPDGEPLEINFASMSGGDVSEPLANYYIQSWRAVGLNVGLINGRLIEYNSFYDMLGNDDPDIDIFLAGWSIGTDVDQNALFAADAPYNFIRYESEEQTELLRLGSSAEALDIDVRIQAYNDWQALMAEEVVIIPTLYRAGVYPISTDIVNYSVEYGYNEDYLLYRLGLSE